MTEARLMSLLGTWAALIAVSLGIFAFTLDGSMMPVAIGSIAYDLDTQVAYVHAAMALHSLVLASAYYTLIPVGMSYRQIWCTALSPVPCD